MSRHGEEWAEIPGDPKSKYSLSSILHLSCQIQEIMTWCLPSVLEQITKPSGWVSSLINSPDFYKGIHLISLETSESGSLNLSWLPGHSVISAQRNNTSGKRFIPFSGKWDELPSETFPCAGILGRFSPTGTGTALVATGVSALIFFIKASSCEIRKRQYTLGWVLIWK